MVEIAQEIADEIKLLPNNKPLILLGHSMGAVIALETTKQLEKNGIAITHLFASGSRNGPLPKKEIYIEEDEKTFCKNLIKMGGTNPEALKDPMFLELVLPSIRADGKMFNKYKMDKKIKTQCSITTIYGNNDHHADIRPWSNITLNNFREFCVVGDHFYLNKNPPYQIIMDTIEKSNTNKK